MIYEFKCDNDNCSEKGKVVERNISSSQIEDQLCEKCNEKLKRVWSFGGGIKTNDGYKA
jgi:predicted nucleic acid-binding Zn ribbon protein